jgi:hypothetical protein
MFFRTCREDEKVLGERCSLSLTAEELRLVFVDLARKRRRYREKTYSNYLVERTVVFPEYTLPVLVFCSTVALSAVIVCNTIETSITVCTNYVQSEHSTFRSYHRGLAEAEFVLLLYR